MGWAGEAEECVEERVGMGAKGKGKPATEILLTVQGAFIPAAEPVLVQFRVQFQEVQ